MRARGKVWGACVAAAIVLAGAAVTATPAAAAPRKETRPNVVVIMSDDQTQDSIRYMDDTRRLIGGRGATFPTTVTNWPLCCPSRATFLTGRYAHNHHVLGNLPPLGGFDRLDGANTLPVWLERAGYHTAHIGKYLNGYEDSPVGVPPGWTEWHGSKQTYFFYGYELLEGGRLVGYGSNGENPDAPAEPEAYSTDVYTEKAVKLISQRAPKRRPFLLSVAYLAPHNGGPNPLPAGRCHGSAKPAARHIGALADEPLPRPPNFNEADVSDKPSVIANRDPLTPEQIGRATREYRCRSESLLAIDDGVQRIVRALGDAGELDDTLVIYTSDNGFFHGEHRVETTKNLVYEEATRVPLLMRGPGIPKGVSVDDVASNADLAPTILDAAEVEPGLSVDGHSLIPFARHPGRLHGRELLIEQWHEDGDQDLRVFYKAVRNSRYIYVRYAAGPSELYDLEADPYQLSNLVGDPAYDVVEAALGARLAGLAPCRGGGCRTKPALKLELPDKERRGERACRRAEDFVARVRGRDAGGVEEVAFGVGKKLDGRNRGEPLKERIKPKLLRRDSRPDVRAIAELIDGRALSLQQRVRICG